MAARRLNRNEAKHQLGEKQYSNYLHEEALLARGDILPNQLTTHVPPQGTYKKANGQYTDSTRLEMAELYVSAGKNMDRAWQLFRVAHPNIPRHNLPDRKTFAYQYRKLQEKKTVQDTVNMLI